MEVVIEGTTQTLKLSHFLAQFYLARLFRLSSLLASIHENTALTLELRILLRLSPHPGALLKIQDVQLLLDLLLN